MSKRVAFHRQPPVALIDVIDGSWHPHCLLCAMLREVVRSGAKVEAVRGPTRIGWRGVV
jgi:hypothetical protein